MASDLRQAFRNYFLTAQLTVGPAMALKLADEGWLGVIVGFLATIPVVALLAWWRAAYVTKHPESAIPVKPRWVRTIIIGVVCAAVTIAALIATSIALKPPA